MKILDPNPLYRGGGELKVTLFWPKIFMKIFKEPVELGSWNFQGIILGYRRVFPESFSPLAQLLPEKFFKNFLSAKILEIFWAKSFEIFFEEPVELEDWNFEEIIFYTPRLYPENFSFLAQPLHCKKILKIYWDRFGPIGARGSLGARVLKGYKGAN